jgi:DNA-directed RNA polymerase subunit RPC12/RpoP
MMLACSRRCGGTLFRALFAEVEVDAEGAYLDYRIAQPGYICLNCGSPAFDLGEVPAEMEAEAREDETKAVTADILCPVCETLVQVDEGMECPNCGAPLEVA